MLGPNLFFSEKFLEKEMRITAIENLVITYVKPGMKEIWPFLVLLNLFSITNHGGSSVERLFYSGSISF